VSQGDALARRPRHRLREDRRDRGRRGVRRDGPSFRPGTRAGAGRGWEDFGGFRPGRIEKILENALTRISRIFTD